MYKMLKIIVDLYPQYKYSVEEYRESENGFYKNMFIMRKEKFFQYVEFMLNIFQQFDEYYGFK